MNKLGRHQKLMSAELLEAAGQFELAEEYILDVLSELDPEKDQAMIGALHINLGSIAGSAGKTQDAIKYHCQAVKLLDGLKGDSVLQCAHAHFNVAKIYILRKDAKAFEHSERALELYQKYPFSDETDIVDARISVQISRKIVHKPLDLEELHDLWDDIKYIPSKSLTVPIVHEFVLMCASLDNGKSFPDIVKEFSDWLG